MGKAYLRDYLLFFRKRAPTHPADASGLGRATALLTFLEAQGSGPVAIAPAPAPGS